MYLKNINEIENGMVVFMPSGIQATLSIENGDIIVEYPEMYKDCYTKEQFEKLIEEGIFIFEEPSQMIMEDFEEDVFEELIKFADNEGVNVYELDQFDAADIAEFITDELGHQVDVETVERLIAQEIEDMENLGLEMEDDEIDESILEKLTKKGYIRDALSEAYKQEDNQPGSVYTAQKDKNLEYVTADFKNAILTKLTRIAKEYPNVHVRQQATTFIDELGLQEYYDIKAVKDFVDKYLKTLTEELGDYANNYGLQNIAEQIQDGNKSGDSDVFGSWFLTTSLDEKWNNLTQNAKDYILENISYPVYDGHLSYTDLELVLHSGSVLNEEDLKSMELFDNEQITEILSENGEETAYISYQLHLEDEGGLEESFKIKKKKKKQKIEDSLHEELKVGDKVEYLNWYGDTVEGTGVVKHIEPGLAGHGDTTPSRVITIQSDKGNIFKQDEHRVRKINEDVEETDLGLYIQTAGDLYNKYISGKQKDQVDWDNLVNDGVNGYKEKIKNIEFTDEDKEAAKEYVKTYFFENVNENIYLKDKEGNEEGPFQDQEAKEEFLKTQKENGNNKEYEEVIKEDNMKNEAMNVLDQNIKTWYQGKYETDELGEELNDVTFNELEKRMRAGEDVYDILGVGDSIVRERVFDFADRYGKKDLYNLWLSMGRIKSNKQVVHEDCYKVYNTINPDDAATELGSWQDVEEFLNAQWGAYQVDMAKQNADFGTEDDRLEFLANFEVEFIPAEDIVTEPIESVNEEPIDEEPIEDCENCEDREPVMEDLENPEEQEETEEQEEEIESPEQAKDAIDKIEDTVDSLEDFIKTLLDDEEVEDVKTEEEQEGTQEKIEEPEQEIQEEFADNMSAMLTNINDLDFPDAMHDAVDVKEDGTLYQLSDLAKELADFKTSIKSEIESIKNDLKMTLQDIKQDLKQDFNNVETKVQDTKSVVDNLTAEEEDLESMEMEEPIEEAPAEEEVEEETQEEEQVEESFNDEYYAGTPIYESIKHIVQGKKFISIPTIAEALRENYGINTKVESTYKTVKQIVENTSFKSLIVDPVQEKQMFKESMLGKASKWLGSGLLGKLGNEKRQPLDEDIAKVKMEIDKLTKEGKDAQTIKDTITLQADNDQEQEEAEKYAVEQIQKNAQADAMKEALLRTARHSTLNTLKYN